MAVARRPYQLGKCQDCGHVKRTTVIRFWATGYKYRVCASCKRAYVRVITTARTTAEYDREV